MTKYSVDDEIQTGIEEIKGEVNAVEDRQVLNTEKQVLCYGIDWTIPSLNYRFSTFEEVKTIDDAISCLVMSRSMLSGGTIGGSSTLLNQRLTEAKGLLLQRWITILSGATFDFQKKQFLSKPMKDGKQYALQWALRKNIMLPESYHNQQTSRGGVWVVEAW